MTLKNLVGQAQKFESLDTLAGDITHEFNNTLGLIMELAELLRLKISRKEGSNQMIDNDR